MRKGTVGRGFCKQCDEEVSVTLEDQGIGPYEYWGAKGNQVDLRGVCSQCGEEMDGWEEAELDVPDRDERSERWT